MKASQKDVNKAHIEAAEVKQRSLLLYQQKQSLLDMMGALVNRDIQEEDLRPFPILNIPKEQLELNELIEQAHQNRPEIKEAALSVEAAEHARSLSKYEYAPDIFVGFQYFGIGNGSTSDPNDGRDAWMIPLKFTIPLWPNRVVPLGKEAKEILNVSQGRLKDVENLSDYEVKNAFYKFSTSKEIVDLYEKVLRPQSEMALRSEKAGYESGNIDLLNLIDSERLYLNTKIASHQALADGLKNFAALERMVGIDLAEQGGLK
jgi:cobalt-zinc-cadmium efflux system outer membrane protein